MGVKVNLRIPDNASPETVDYHLKTALKKFKKMCNRAGVVRDYRRHEYYEKPSDKKRRAKSRRLANIKKAQKERAEEGI